jgi:hypothetical protein
MRHCVSKDILGYIRKKLIKTLKSARNQFRNVDFSRFSDVEIIDFISASDGKNPSSDGKPTGSDGYNPQTAG